ncbi:MAG: RluA family pseudouridine synthase [Cyclobacteriaceae bacterium]|nr:RluA family pseudouridine synthase [Cyclobacteriaceae bacterium]
MPKFKFEDAILYRDDDFILINKPPFISTLEDRNDSQNILSLARAYEPDAQVCHRLDKETSGVLAIARNPEAYRHLSMQFENRTVTKIYHAVADGNHNFKDQKVDAPILKQNDGTAKISRSGKEAQTHFTTYQSYKNHTLVACQPVTGRMHQIRVHLAFLKAPITGDEMYGGKPFYVSSIKRGFNLKKLTEEEPLIKRMALHAFSLEFNLLDGSKMTIEAPYPKDFQALIRQLSENKR